MRAALPLAVGAAVALLAAGNAGGGTQRMRLPAAVMVTSGHVGYRISRDGEAVRIRTATAPTARGAAWFGDGGQWFRVAHRHLIVGWGARRLWRSRAEFPQWFRIGVVVIARGHVAFSYDNALYLAAMSGPERRISRTEFPLGWTAGGLYTYGWRGRRVLLRTETGTVAKTIARRIPLGHVYYDNASRGLYFLAAGALMSAHGSQVTRLAAVTTLGLHDAPTLVFNPVGRLVEVSDRRRLVVVRPDGSVLASSGLPRGDGQISSSLAVSPAGDAVAYTAASGRNAGRGSETVYVLRAGTRAAVAVHRERVVYAPCERGAGVAWHGRWVLYTATEGNVAVIDTARGERAVELRAFIKALPGIRAGWSAFWD